MSPTSRGGWDDYTGLFPHPGLLLAIKMFKPKGVKLPVFSIDITPGIAK